MIDEAYRIRFQKTISTSRPSATRARINHHDWLVTGLRYCQCRMTLRSRKEEYCNGYPLNQPAYDVAANSRILMLTCWVWTIGLGMYPGIQSLVAGMNDGELKRWHSSYSSGDHWKEKSHHANRRVAEVVGPIPTASHHHHHRHLHHHHHHHHHCLH